MVKKSWLAINGKIRCVPAGNENSVGSNGTRFLEIRYVWIDTAQKE
jgi:hypothetical protein